MLRKTFLAVSALLVCSVGSLQAGTMITSAVKVSGNAAPISIDQFSFDNGAPAYTDRGDPLNDPGDLGHTYQNVPSELVGAEYVMVSNSDKTSDPYQVDVTVSELSLIYVLLDNRVGGGDSSSTPTPMAWMTDGSIGLSPMVDTLVDVDIDEGNDGSLDNAFSLFVTLALPGTYNFLGQNDGGGRNNYGILVSDTLVVPEPGTFVLAALGLVGFLACRTRRQTS